MSKHPRLRARLRDAIEGPALAARLVVELAVLRTQAAARATVRAIARRLAATSSRFSIRSLVASTTAIGFGVLVAVTGAGTTFAFLNSQAQVGTATISASNAVLTVSYNGGTASPAATMPDSLWQTMLPGDAITQQVTVANPSAAKFAVSSRLETVGYYEIRTLPGACAASINSAAALTTAAAALTTLTAGASTVVCVQVKLSTSAPSNLQPGSASPITAVPFKLVFDGTQVQ